MATAVPASSTDPSKVPLRIENAIGDIALSGDGGPGSLYVPCSPFAFCDARQTHYVSACEFDQDEEVEGGTYIDIDLRCLPTICWLFPYSTCVSIVPLFSPGFLLDASVVNASDLSNIPSCIQMHANYWQVSLAQRLRALIRTNCRAAKASCQGVRLSSRGWRHLSTSTRPWEPELNVRFSSVLGIWSRSRPRLCKE